MKKNYFAFETKSIKSKMGFKKITLSIFEKENLEKIGQVEYCTASTPGEHSEVYQFLIKNGNIPQEAFDFSKTQIHGAGYYVGNNPYCTITIL